MKHNPIEGLEETLLQVDLRTDQLKAFLDKITATVNGHTQYLKTMQVQIDTAVKQPDYSTHLGRVADSLSLRDSDFLNQVSFLLEKPLPENSADQVENAISKLINKEHTMSQGMGFLYRRSKDWEQRVQKLEYELLKKVNKDELQSGLREQKAKLTEDIENGDKKQLKKLQEIERAMTLHQNQLLQNHNDLEKKTLWKISDCEKLLQQRINDKYVETSCQGVYDKVMRDIAKQKDEGIKGLQVEMQELKGKIQYNEERSGDAINGLKEQLRELNDQLMQKYCTLEKHEQNKQILNERTLDLQHKVAELLRKVDSVMALEKLIPTIKLMEDKLADCQHRGELNRKDIEELRIRFESGEGGGGARGKSDIDPHKVCQLEAEMKLVKNDQKDLESKVRLIENELKRKIDQNEQRFIQQLNILKQGQPQGLTKDDVLTIVDKELSMPLSMLRSRIMAILGQACGENVSFEMIMRNLIGDVGDLKKKLEALGDLERRISKRLKQATSNDTGDFMKFLSEKANEEETKVRFISVDERYKTLIDSINYLTRTIKDLEEFINHLQTLMHVNSQETLSILTGNHRVVTQRCVVCGIKNKQSKTVDKNTDFTQARLFRGDLRPKDSAYENQDVYEINPSQVTLVQEQQKYLSTTVGFKYPLVNQNQKSEISSSGRMLRPASAQPKKV